MNQPDPSGGRIVPISDSHALSDAVRLLAGGEVVGMPTDTVYGLAASLDSAFGLGRVYDMKGRPADKPLPILVSDAAELGHLSNGVPGRLLALANRWWPGPLTVVIPARRWLPPEVVAFDTDNQATVGVRVPDHFGARALIAAAGGALAVTSANRSGMPEATTAEGVLASCPEVSLVLDDGPSRGGTPSTVVAIRNGDLVVLREGAIPAATVLGSW